MSWRCGLFAAGIGFALASPVAAQTAQAPQERGSDTVYRCGADGRQYSDSACPEGKAVAATDARSVEQRRHAEEVARRDREFADRMAKEREQRERNAPGAVGIGSSGSAKPTSTAAATATGPKKSPRKKKQKTLHAARQRA
jgi:hypothetical protein